MKALPHALRQIADAVPLVQSVATEDLETLVSVLAQQFGLDPARAAKEIRGSSTLARLIRAACSVPVRAPRPRGRPPKTSMARELDLIRHLERRALGQTKAAAIEEYASAKGETVEAVKKRESRTDQLWK